MKNLKLPVWISKKIKAAKPRVAALVLIVFLYAIVCSMTVISIDISKLNTELNNLYLIKDTSHSGMVGVFIENTESLLYQKIAFLILSSIFLCIVVLALFKEQRGRVVRLRTPSPRRYLAVASLIFCLLVQIASAQVIHYYARVEMDISSEPYFIEVCGFVTPKPAEVNQGWVCYHLGVVWPATGEWIGGGYFSELGVGTVFYIEWRIKGIYYEITKEGVSFDKQYFVAVSLCFPIGDSWGVWIYDDHSKLVLNKTGVDLTQGKMIAIAGGESIWQHNRMLASFSELMWVYFDRASGEFLYGRWGENKFTCTVIKNPPYSVSLTKPYYNFTVSGGNEILYPGGPGRECFFYTGSPD